MAKSINNWRAFVNLHTKFGAQYPVIMAFTIMKWVYVEQSQKYKKIIGKSLNKLYHHDKHVTYRLLGLYDKSDEIDVHLTPSSTSLPLKMELLYVFSLVANQSGLASLALTATGFMVTTSQACPCRSIDNVSQPCVPGCTDNEGIYMPDKLMLEVLLS
eukprot:m.258385 g.258385  ORF g.258385 m.258385 type:complete len:158 (-) comp16192_c0_seq48:1767-2240(-)